MLTGKNYGESSVHGVWQLPSPFLNLISLIPASRFSRRSLHKCRTGYYTRNVTRRCVEKAKNKVPSKIFATATCINTFVISEYSDTILHHAVAKPSLKMVILREWGVSLTARETDCVCCPTVTTSRHM